MCAGVGELRGPTAWPGPHQQQRSLAPLHSSTWWPHRQGEGPDSLGSRLPSPTASEESSTSGSVPGEPLPHPTLPGWQERRDSQARSPQSGVGLGSVLSGPGAPHLDEAAILRHLKVPRSFGCLSEHGVHCAQWFSSCCCFSEYQNRPRQGGGGRTLKIPTDQTAPALDQLATAPAPNPGPCL